MVSRQQQQHGVDQQRHDDVACTKARPTSPSATRRPSPKAHRHMYPRYTPRLYRICQYGEQGGTEHVRDRLAQHHAMVFGRLRDLRRIAYARWTEQVIQEGDRRRCQQNLLLIRPDQHVLVVCLGHVDRLDVRKRAHVCRTSDFFQTRSRTPPKLLRCAPPRRTPESRPQSPFLHDVLGEQRVGDLTNASTISGPVR
jgi:hypothetical protein